MKWADIQSAIRQRWIDGNFLTTIYSGRGGEPTAGTPYAAFWFMPSVTTPSTTGPSGRDLAEGIVQINLMYPTDEGAGEALEMADSIAAHFQAGTRLEYNGQDVIIRGASISPPMVEGGWMMLPVSVNWSSYVTRSL
jgi:hypothetical protein